VGIVLIGMRSQSLADIGFYGGGKEPAVAQPCQRISERSFLQHEVTAVQFAIQAPMLDEQQQGHQEHGQQRDHHPEIRHLRGKMRIKQGIQRHDRQ
jgi:hypothetical protein